MSKLTKEEISTLQNCPTSNEDVKFGRNIAFIEGYETAQDSIDVEKAKAILREAGYFTDNLWTVNDVSDKFKCDAETAQGILYDALTNEYIVEQIQSTIRDLATTEGLD